MHNIEIVTIDVAQPRIDGLKIWKTVFELGDKGWYHLGEIGCSGEGRGCR